MQFSCPFSRYFIFGMGLVSAFYHGVTKRTSTWALAIVVSTLVFERAYDSTCDYIFETHNRGRIWKDIKHKYERED